MEQQQSYPSDLTDAQWAMLEPLLVRAPRSDGRGRPREVDVREVLNAILYVLREGCRWRAVPHDLPNWNRHEGFALTAQHESLGLLPSTVQGCGLRPRLGLVP